MGVSYFVMDAILICVYHPRSFKEKATFTVHHLLCGICMSAVFKMHPLFTYLTALNFLIEWSTVALNMRIFAKLYSMERTYFVCGWCVLITYPFTRIAWNAWLMWISFGSYYIPHLVCDGAQYILGGVQCFVCLMSIYYYFCVILANPKKMYILKKEHAF